MRLFLSGLAAISLLPAPMAGCKKEAQATGETAATEIPAGEQPAGGAEKAAGVPAVVAEVPAEVPVVAVAGDDAAVESGIRLMEEFGTIMGANKADCDKLAEDLKPFIEKNGKTMKSFNETMEKATPEIQEAVKTKYAARMEKTMGEIMAAGMACGENEKVKAVLATMAGAEAPAGKAPAAEAPADAQREPVLIPITQVTCSGGRCAGSAPAAPGIPPLTFIDQNYNYERVEEAQQHNLEGLKFYKKDRGAAIQKYLQALVINPMHEYARYNLACALALDDDPRALMLLKELAAAGTKACLKLVAGAPKDSDFKKLAKDPTFIALTNAAKASLKAGRVADFYSLLNKPSAGQAQIFNVQSAHFFSLTDRFQVSWAEPTLVYGINFVEEYCDQFAVARFAGNEPVLLTSGNNALATPIMASSVELFVGPKVGFDPYCEELGLTISIFGSSVQPHYDYRRDEIDHPKDKIELYLESDGDVKISGFPAVSADGRLVAYLWHSSHYAGSTSVHVIDSVSNKHRFSLGFKDHQEGEDEEEAKIRRFDNSLALKKLREASNEWIPMRREGAALNITRQGKPVRFLGALEGYVMRVVDFYGALLYEKAQPRWGIIYDDTSRVDTSGQSCRLLMEKGNTYQHYVAQYHAAVWIDPDFRTLLLISHCNTNEDDSMVYGYTHHAMPLKRPSH